jgi:hypothetical protein
LCSLASRAGLALPYHGVLTKNGFRRKRKVAGCGGCPPKDRAAVLPVATCTAQTTAGSDDSAKSGESRETLLASALGLCQADVPTGEAHGSVCLVT